MPDRWVHDRLRSGHAVVLVDGVDEIPKERRQEVEEWLRELVATYDTARFIVTSRPHAVPPGWMAPHGFSEAELQPMSLADIDTFIEHWHAAVRDEVQEAEEQARLEKLSRHLQGILKDNRPIRSLATSPLLCAMLCALHRDRHQQLPADRIELYEACCWMLLERRDIERRVELRDYPSLSYRQKRLLLEDLAYHLLKNGWSEVSLERAEERFSAKLGNMPGLPASVTGADVRRLLVERSGVVREPVAGQLDFVHRTFQEFLAAKAALDEGDLGMLVKNAHDDQWHEVILLAAGLANVRQREELLTGLMTRGDQESRYRHSLHLLAVACLL